MPEGNELMEVMLSALQMSHMLGDTPYLGEPMPASDDDTPKDEDQGIEFDAIEARRLTDSSLHTRQVERLLDEEVENIRKRATAGFSNAQMLCPRESEYHKGVAKRLKARGFQLDDMENDAGEYLYTRVSW